LESESYLRQSACTAVIIARKRAASQYKKWENAHFKGFFLEKGKNQENNNFTS
jgi:hypothetical protein